MWAVIRPFLAAAAVVAGGGLGPSKPPQRRSR